MKAHKTYQKRSASTGETVPHLLFEVDQQTRSRCLGGEKLLSVQIGLSSRRSRSVVEQQRGGRWERRAEEEKPDTQEVAEGSEHPEWTAPGRFKPLG
ncbi:hypothetical protein MHYP_G00074580 [Metynnis hypsauchen]